ncbi:hypothetical protein BEWA_020680 [Theileria equi strain WA]|uniref:Uncharacterized protein n=1 Tax=Theileria equi strain WA TaxID=1537102 RepID=L0AW11_THEEQ|nr:hypothetical protein BEWA_020680 [Theileria equi strain WA]AFZ79221.1 hypothetical protein BEWA_020680 [Theileria equi strain WA]|eukprot:XP_004828887.1 hypothetical protein BEWA_020680 [Theileria equi strain WA]
MGITYSVIADISQNVSNGTKTYYGKNGNTIGLTRSNEPKIKTKDRGNEEEPLKNYKQYHHKFPENNAWWSVTYELEAINHGSNKQEGLNKVGFKTYKALKVVYWLRDEHNSFPLIIGLGTDTVTYFKRSETITNRWEKADKIIHPADLSDYNRVLCELNKNFRNVVIVSINADNKQNYCGHPSVKQGESTPNDCEEKPTFPTVKVTCNGWTTKGFDRYNHKLCDNTSMRILSALYSDSVYSFEKRDVYTQISEVNVYYSSDDAARKKPLITELVISTGISEYYTFNDGFTKIDLDGNGLTCHLDELNCRQNNIVVANVSKKENYCCKCRCERDKERIRVTKNTGSANAPSGYSIYEHTLESTGDQASPKPSFNKHRFRDDPKDFTWSESSMTDIKKVYVYFCDNNTNMPLLIYVDKGSGYGKWFKRTSGGSTTWISDDSSSLQSKFPESEANGEINKALLEICKVFKLNCEHPSSSDNGKASGEPALGGKAKGPKQGDSETDSSLNSPFPETKTSSVERSNSIETVPKIEITQEGRDNSGQDQPSDPNKTNVANSNIREGEGHTNGIDDIEQSNNSENGNLSPSPKNSPTVPLELPISLEKVRQFFESIGFTTDKLIKAASIGGFGAVSIGTGKLIHFCITRPV